MLLNVALLTLTGKHSLSRDDANTPSRENIEFYNNNYNARAFASKNNRSDVTDYFLDLRGLRPNTSDQRNLATAGRSKQMNSI